MAALIIRVFSGLSAELLCTVSIDPEWDVADLKCEINQQLGIPEIEQRLLVGSRLLCNRDTIACVVDALQPGGVIISLMRLDPQRAKTLDQLARGLAKLDNISMELKQDREAVLLAVRQHGKSLEHAADELKSDAEVVLAAVAQDGLAIQHASEALQHDHKVVIKALQQNGWAIELLPEAVRGDRELALTAVRSRGQSYRHLPKHLQQDRQVILAAVASDGETWHYIPHELQADREVVEATMQGAGGGDFGSGAPFGGGGPNIKLLVQQKSLFTLNCTR